MNEVRVPRLVGVPGGKESPILNTVILNEVRVKNLPTLRTSGKEISPVFGDSSVFIPTSVRISPDRSVAGFLRMTRSGLSFPHRGLFEMNEVRVKFYLPDCFGQAGYFYLLFGRNI